ncbi:fused MFS/spermidine synthase [Hoeflea sp. YIM 152468]|uniref:fused MFS/spermidine synthase n=1 Tax=Hoeflea sp. YIM 152468 TaxID=3031759 RepID=UPI0023DC4D9D|nr:fused MFS/spermidine synthase [Hoeflea sp. YIM 152468]MDF1607054.1 fused MFS/spermidine synthase [Hoeflea sp. YIM 152468]
MPTPRLHVPLGLLVAIQAAVSGVSLVVEIVAGRMLAPYVGMSLYSWTSIIAVVLAGFSAGHWWGGHIASRPPRQALIITGWILLAAAISTASALLVLRLIGGPVLEAVSHPVWSIVALTGGVFFLPSLFAGVPAPVLAQIAVTAQADQSGRALGAMFTAGAVGAIAGTLLAGFVFIPWLGTAVTLAIVTAVYLGAAALIFWLARPLSRPVATIALAALAIVLGTLSVTRLSSCTSESQYFCIRVLDMSATSGSPVRRLVLDHLSHGTSARDLPRTMFSEFTAMLDAIARQRMQSRPFSAFFIGGGTYSVPRAWADRNTGPITVAEIDPEVTRTAVRDFWLDPAGITILDEDARVALQRRPDARYDVIVGDAFGDIAVPAHLITREFFQLVRSQLSKNGVFLMNVVDFPERLQALGAITATLQSVFPSVEIWTQASLPTPGEQRVFVLVAAVTPTEFSTITAAAPDATRFAVMAQSFTDRLVARSSPAILTDDYAPIDRLLGG